MATIPIMELLSTLPGESQLMQGVQGQPAAGSTRHGTKCVVQTGLLPAATGTGVRCSAGILQSTSSSKITSASAPQEFISLYAQSAVFPPVIARAYCRTVRFLAK